MYWKQTSVHMINLFRDSECKQTELLNEYHVSLFVRSNSHKAPAAKQEPLTKIVKF
jgi:hypothetical protein